jgi:dihydroorotase
VRAVRDVAIRDGRVAAVAAGIPAGEQATIDAAGKLVLPGLIDLHAHLFHGYHGARPDDACLPRGTTTAVDGGSSGANAFSGFEEHIIRASRTRVRAWLNISTLGLIEIRIGELMQLIAVDVEAAVRTATRYPGTIVGFKVRISEYVAGADFKPALRLAREASDATGLPLMVHIGDTNDPLPAALALLRPGDVVTHAFTGRRHGILDYSGRVLDAVREARAAGIWFDAAHGRRHFGFEAIKRSLEQGFIVDTLSSDTSMRSTKDPGYHLPLLMTKLMALGLGIDELVPLVTSNPARFLGAAGELGTLAAGACADVAILEEVRGPVALRDAEGQSIEAQSRLRPWRTVRAGRIIEASPDA